MKNYRWILLPAVALTLCLAAACGMAPVNNDANHGGSVMPGGNLPPNGTAPGDATGRDQPVIPDSLSRADADVTVDDLIATLGQKKDDLMDAMKNVATVGDGVDGARTYRHKLLGHDSDVSYTFGSKGTIDRVTVTVDPGYADDWKTHLKDVLKAKAVEGETDRWTYGSSSVHMEEKDGKEIIVFEKTV